MKLTGSLDRLFKMLMLMALLAGIIVVVVPNPPERLTISSLYRIDLLYTVKTTRPTPTRVPVRIHRRQSR